MVNNLPQNSLIDGKGIWSMTSHADGTRIWPMTSLTDEKGIWSMTFPRTPSQMGQEYGQ